MSNNITTNRINSSMINMTIKAVTTIIMTNTKTSSRIMESTTIMVVKEITNNLTRRLKDSSKTNRWMITHTIMMGIKSLLLKTTTMILPCISRISNKMINTISTNNRRTLIIHRSMLGISPLLIMAKIRLNKLRSNKNMKSLTTTTRNKRNSRSKLSKMLKHQHRLWWMLTGLNLPLRNLRHR